MRGYLKSFLLFSILCNITTAWAGDKVGDICNTSAPCVAGLYCDAEFGKCADCSEQAGNDYPHSEEGATSIEQCYQTCAPAYVIPLGQKVPTRGRAYYKSPTPEKCEYTITCSDKKHAELTADGNACECKANYQQVGTGTDATCTGKCYTITLEKNLTNIWESPKYLSVRFGTGFYKNKICSGTALTSSDEWVTPNYRWFQKFNGYSIDQNGGTYRFGSDGKPTNGTTNTTFTDNITLYGQWNTNNYTVEYYDGDKYLFNQTCKVAEYNTDTPTSDGKCQAITTNKSNDQGKTVVGWSSTKSGAIINYSFGTNIQPTAATIKLYAVWAPCPKGYYCNASGKESCPAGSTSDAGSTEIGKCYISSATQFRDKLGTFSLPIGTIYYQ